MALKLVVILGALAACKSPPPADGSMGTPGVSATEIKLGQTMPISGNASSYAVIGRADRAYFQMINDQGGINGRKVTLITEDDGYAPPKTLELTRKLVEHDGVALIFNSLGTAPNAATQRYLNDKKIPQLFVATGADRWADPSKFPWTMGWQPSYRVEAKIYARYLQKTRPDAKLCVLYQNDDFGKDYLAGLKAGFGAQYDKTVIKAESYEVADPTVDSQLVALAGAGCDTELTAATPKAAVNAIRKMAELGWKPLHILTNVSVSITTVLAPAGLDNSTGIITATYLKDPGDPSVSSDHDLLAYRAFVKQYLPDVDPADSFAVYAYGVSMTMARVLTQAGNDLSRDNLMKQATSLAHVKIPVAIFGAELNTSATDYEPFSQMRLARFNGKSFEPFTDAIDAD
ncbi:MAG TPA: ABC transporter substrate-binding protein [Kofleriaceae bacterium]